MNIIISIPNNRVEDVALAFKEIRGIALEEETPKTAQAIIKAGVISEIREVVAQHAARKAAIDARGAGVIAE